MSEQTAKKRNYSKLIHKNKKAFFDYEVMEKLEAGMRLNGSEVKSCKEGRVQLKGSFVRVYNGKVVVENMHITAYRYSNEKEELNPLRTRELLAKKDEIEFLEAKTQEKGLTVVPLELWNKNGLVKLLIGVCRGKKVFDKRRIIKERELNRHMSRSLKD